MPDEWNARCQVVRDLFRTNQIEKAVADARILAAEGYPPAQVILGWAHEVGHTGRVDKEEARRQYAAAAEAGDFGGQYYLGALLLRQENWELGRQWIERAAQQQYPPALYRLGKLYTYGVGGRTDRNAALACIKRAAAAGHPIAQKVIAMRGIRGQEGFSGFIRGLIWFASFVPRFAFKVFRQGPPDPNLLDE